MITCLYMVHNYLNVLFFSYVNKNVHIFPTTSILTFVQKYEKRSIIKDTIGKQHKQSLDDFESLLHILQIILYNLYVLHNCYIYIGHMNYKITP